MIATCDFLLASFLFSCHLEGALASPWRWNDVSHRPHGSAADVLDSLLALAALMSNACERWLIFLQQTWKTSFSACALRYLTNKNTMAWSVHAFSSKTFQEKPNLLKKNTTKLSCRNGYCSLTVLAPIKKYACWTNCNCKISAFRVALFERFLALHYRWNSLNLIFLRKMFTFTWFSLCMVQNNWTDLV